jgi:hypothetical protein
MRCVTGRVLATLEAIRGGGGRHGVLGRVGLSGRLVRGNCFPVSFLALAVSLVN